MAAHAAGLRSLTTRLIVWTLVAVGGVYLATVAAGNTLAREMAMAAAEREAVNETEAAVSPVEDLLHSIEERTLTLGEALSVLRPRAGEADSLLRRFVEGNRDIYGVAIAWRPGPRGERHVLQRATPENRRRLEPIVQKMLAGEKGFARVEFDGRPFRLTYRPLRRAGWALAALYPGDELAFALAGHEPPILLPEGGAPEPLPAEGGRVLGLIETWEFPVNRLRLGAGDAVLLYTDGVSEAQDEKGGFFGVERIVRAAAGLRHEAAPALTEGMLAAVRAFAGAAPQSDDITILTLRRLG